METTENYDPRFVTKYSNEDAQLKRFHDAGASDAYVAVAQKIVNGEPLTQTEIKALGDEVDVMYRPLDESSRKYWHSLLSYATDQQNLEAIKSLLEAGVDPNEEPNFATWASLQMTNPYLGATEENFTFAKEATRLYLQYGGDENYQNPYTGDTLLSDFEVNQNIWSVDLLLEAGADPWLKDKRGVAFLESLSLTPASLHTLQKSAEMGWFRKAPDGNTLDKFFDEVLPNYISAYHDFKDNADMAYYRPDFRAFLRALLDNSDYQATPEMLAIINEKD